MSSVRPVGPGFSPLDDILGPLPSQFSPFLVQCIVRLGTLMPFEQVPDLLVFLTGVHVSVETVRRLTERAGAVQVTLEEHQLDDLEHDLPEVPVGPGHQQVSVDGVMIPLTHGEWAEGRMIAIGTLGVVDGTTTAHARDIVYVSRLCTAHAFIRQAALLFYERGIAPTDDTVVAVMDGAD